MNKATMLKEETKKRINEQLKDGKAILADLKMAKEANTPNVDLLEERALNAIQRLNQLKQVYFGGK
jgi:hypothetical protein